MGSVHTINIDKVGPLDWWDELKQMLSTVLVFLNIREFFLLARDHLANVHVLGPDVDFKVLVVRIFGEDEGEKQIDGVACVVLLTMFAVQVFLALDVQYFCLGGGVMQLLGNDLVDFDLEHVVI